ncbi:TPA: LysR family transcriptional regulator [Candidatus Micrarchaeota archaeon]|nr:LysR family transcriptional regulator [Candidatus Micrarchaeota archaeon]
MGYNEEIVNIAVGMVLEDHRSVREAARLLHVGRAAISRWVKRTLEGLPTHFSSAPRQVHNRTGENILKRIRKLLEEGAGTIKAWFESGQRTCLRTVQRWKTKWFPPVKEKAESHRYERRKVLSLMHTDWGVKRINEGKRCCFTFYEDDASRRPYATKAYAKADSDSTTDAYVNARSEADFVSGGDSCESFTIRASSSLRYGGSAPEGVFSFLYFRSSSRSVSFSFATFSTRSLNLSSSCPCFAMVCSSLPLLPFSS